MNKNEIIKAMDADYQKGVRALRKRLELNTKEFGALVGVSPRTVESWEQGRKKPLGPAVLLMKIIASLPKNESEPNANN